jgi:hypothetical protein
MLLTFVFPHPSAGYLYNIFKLLLNYIFVNVSPQFMNGHDPIKYMFCNTKFNIITQRKTCPDFLHVNYK